MADYTYDGAPIIEDEEPSGSVLKKARAKVSAGGTLSNNVTASQGAALPMAIDFYGRSNAAQQRAEELQAQPVDYSQLQAFAKQRADQGDAAMMNALAAQFAGERFAPIQEQLLKKAAAARDPIKVGGGLITAEGGFIKDPEAERDKQIQMYANQAARYAQMGMTDEAKKAELAARVMRDKENADFRRDSMEMRRELAQLAAGNSNSSRNATVEDRMADDYEKAIKNDALVTTAFQNLRATPVSAAGDLSFIYQYMKMLDPGSVVREGEFATAQNAAGVPQRIANMYNRIVSGERLSPAQRQEFLATAQGLADAATRRIDSVRSDTTAKAKRRGLDVSNIILGAGKTSTGGNVVDFNSLPK